MRAVVAKMGIFEGKTPSERNKMIAAAALGVLSLLALYIAFFSGSSSSQTSVSVKTTTPTPRGSQSSTSDVALPAPSDLEFQYQTTEVVYTPGSSWSPDPGRNIFAFYEPPPPCTDIALCPPPTPRPIITPTPVPPTPAPTPPLFIAGAQPQSVYAGAAGFELSVSGNEYPVGTRIYFNQAEMPTKQVAPNRLTAQIPSSAIAQAGPRQIIVQTPDGKFYSNQTMLTVQAPPTPSVQYIGMIARKRYNNDTAVFTETPTGPPISRRLNDVVNSRFRIIEISAAEVLVEDVSLGFKHRIPINKVAAATAGNAPPGFGQPPGRPVPVPPRPDVDDNDPPRP